MIRNGSASASQVSSGSGSTFYSGSTEPSKSLDTSVISKLKAGDEYYVLPTSGTPSAGILFKCVDPTAGAAKWRPLEALVQIFDGPPASASGYTAPTVNFPMGFTAHDIEGVGVGGGAGAGGVYDTGVAAYGGDGGDGGVWGSFRLTAAELGSNTTGKILMYPPGAGAAAQSTNSTAGAKGGNGGKTRFQVNNLDIYAWPPGVGGNGGGNAASSQTALAGANVFFAQGGHNVAAHTLGTAANSNGGFKGGTGGPAGGCIDTNNNARAGGGGYGTSDNAVSAN